MNLYLHTFIVAPGGKKETPVAAATGVLD